MVLFSAEWAEQCSQILNIMNELAKQTDFKDLQFLNVPAEEFSEISLSNKVGMRMSIYCQVKLWQSCSELSIILISYLQIEAVPTVLYISKNSAIDRIDGVDIATLTTKCKKYAKVELASIPKEPLENRLKTLINKSKLMIFMKGDRNGPRCGFSKQLIAIVNDAK